MTVEFLRQFIHEAAAEHPLPIFSSISFRSPKRCCFNFVEPMWNRSPLVGVGLGALRKGENEFSYQKRILFAVESINELVPIWGIKSDSETP